MTVTIHTFEKTVYYSHTNKYEYDIILATSHDPKIIRGSCSHLDPIITITTWMNFYVQVQRLRQDKIQGG